MKPSKKKHRLGSELTILLSTVATMTKALKTLENLTQHF
ncbi:hypothetical protein SeseC_02226 [Streptococcus equi subsp. zooepidemicus ATCC 35246]|nr:hypothetical protein SeseC_02226 [Streptococcus equi subsp. zooepidemicus ATCC 35246]